MVEKKGLRALFLFVSDMVYLRKESQMAYSRRGKARDHARRYRGHVLSKFYWVWILRVREIRKAPRISDWD